MNRPLNLPRTTPSEVLRPLGVAVREALRAPRRVWIFNGVLALLCAVVWTVGISGFNEPMFPTGVHLTWWWLALAFYLAEVLVVHLQFRKQAHTLSLTEIGLTLGLLLAAPSAVLFGQIVGTVVALVLNRREDQLRQLRQVRLQPRRAAALQWHRPAGLPIVRLAGRLRPSICR